MTGSNSSDYKEAERCFDALYEPMLHYNTATKEEVKIRNMRERENEMVRKNIKRCPILSPR